MQLYLMHIGEKLSVDVEYTLIRRREIDEVLDRLPRLADKERDVFLGLRKQFPDGWFSCWGLPLVNKKVQDYFNSTSLGSVVLFVIKAGRGGGINHIGVVKARPSRACPEASKILWPKTSDGDRHWPLLFFFDAEIGFYPWSRFLTDVCYQSNYRPSGSYQTVSSIDFLKKWKSAENYLEHVRKVGNFRSVRSTTLSGH